MDIDKLIEFGFDLIGITNKKWFVLNEEQQEIVKKIAAEFPYSIELVSGIFIEQKYSEEKTRDVLMHRTLSGGDYDDSKNRE